MYSTSRVASSSTISSSSIVWGMVSSLVGGRPGGGLDSRLQVTVHEVDLLQPAKALTDVLRTDLSDPLDRLELGVTGGQQLIETAELLDDLAHHQLGQPGDAPHDAVAAR